MPAALKFLLAARRCEIHGLEQLALTCQLVSAIGQLVHMLQRERGVSSVVAASRGARFVDQLGARVADSDAMADAVREGFDRLDTDPGLLPAGARLFSRIAAVVHSLDALPEVRARVRALEMSAEAVTDFYTRLIGGLLTVVFEAADGAGDPDVSRALVALFNFMQGKELAGQERATGAAGFASGRFDSARQHRLVHLVEAQQRCFDIFAEFSDPALAALWEQALPAADLAALERLRRVAMTASDVDAGSDTWFELTTRRIDRMKEVEDRLAVELLRLAERKTAEARAALQDHAAMFDDFVRDAACHGTVEPPAPDGGGAAAPTGLSRSVFDLLHVQSRRLQEMGDELARARAALAERKTIERAKGVLMEHRGLSEDQAYRLLRQQAMDQGRRMVDVAQTVLGFAELLRHEQPSSRR